MYRFVLAGKEIVLHLPCCSLTRDIIFQSESKLNQIQRDDVVLSTYIVNELFSLIILYCIRYQQTVSSSQCLLNQHSLVIFGVLLVNSKTSLLFRQLLLSLPPFVGCKWYRILWIVHKTEFDK